MSEEPIQLDLEIAILKETIKQQQQDIHNLQMRVKELVEQKEELYYEILETQDRSYVPQ